MRINLILACVVAALCGFLFQEHGKRTVAEARFAESQKALQSLQVQSKQAVQADASVQAERRATLDSARLAYRESREVICAEKAQRVRVSIPGRVGVLPDSPVAGDFVRVFNDSITASNAAIESTERLP